MKKAAKNDRLLNIEQICELCGVSRATVRNWRTTGIEGVRLRSLRMGNVIRVKETELDAFLGAMPDELGECNANTRKESA